MEPRFTDAGAAWWSTVASVINLFANLVRKEVGYQQRHLIQQRCSILVITRPPVDDKSPTQCLHADLWLTRLRNLQGCSLEVLEGRLPVLETLAAALPRLPADRWRRVRERTRYRTVAIAGLLAAAGRRTDARRRLLRSLRWGRRPGQILEVLRWWASPASVTRADH